jgi:hypothetical protein
LLPVGVELSSVASRVAQVMKPVPAARPAVQTEVKTAIPA